MPKAPAPTLLYVEDDPVVREITAASLEDAGFEVVMAENATAAFAALETHGDHGIGAVMTDINLGSGPDGWEVARRARQINHKMPVLYVTGAGANNWPSKAVPGSHLLGKPYSPAQIVTAVSALLCQSGVIGSGESSRSRSRDGITN